VGGGPPSARAVEHLRPARRLDPFARHVSDREDRRVLVRPGRNLVGREHVARRLQVADLFLAVDRLVDLRFILFMEWKLLTELLR
jgi:hypothetical protein